MLLGSKQMKTMVLEQLDIHINMYMQKLNLDPGCIHVTKINSQWMTVLNVNCKTIKLLEDNTGENLDDLGCDEALFFRWIDKLNVSKVKNSFSVKDSVKRVRWQNKLGEDITR